LALQSFSEFDYSSIKVNTSLVGNDGTGVVKFSPTFGTVEWGLNLFGPTVGSGWTNNVTFFGPSTSNHNIDQRAITNGWHSLVAIRIWREFLRDRLNIVDESDFKLQSVHSYESS